MDIKAFLATLSTLGKISEVTTFRRGHFACDLTCSERQHNTLSLALTDRPWVRVCFDVVCEVENGVATSVIACYHYYKVSSCTWSDLSILCDSIKALTGIAPE